jgi:hypothetical protein
MPAVNRAEIIRTVQTPLGFFVLVVLIVEVVFGVIAGFSDGTNRTILIIGMMSLISCLVLLVAGMALWRPESLRGRRAVSAAGTPMASASEVTRISSPRVLCAATEQYGQLGFDTDLTTIKRTFKKVQIERDLTSDRLRNLLTTEHFQVIHLLGFVEPKDGALVFSNDDKISAEGFANLLDVCGAQLVVIAACDSIDLAAKASRRANIIAATTVMTVNGFSRWADCFYGLLSRGHALSRAYDIARSTTNAPMVLLMKNDVSFS